MRIHNKSQFSWDNQLPLPGIVVKKFRLEKIAFYRPCKVLFLPCVHYKQHDVWSLQDPPELSPRLKVQLEIAKALILVILHELLNIFTEIPGISLSSYLIWQLKHVRKGLIHTSTLRPLTGLSRRRPTTQGELGNHKSEESICPSLAPIRILP